MKKAITILIIAISFIGNSQKENTFNEGHGTMMFLCFSTSTFVGSVSSVDRATGQVDIKKGVLIQFATGTGMAILKEILLDGITNYNPANLKDFGFSMIGVGVGTILTTVFLNGSKPKEQRFKFN